MKLLIETFENSPMSLSCSGKMIVENNIVLDINFSGYPRTEGDSWVRHYRDNNFGNIITDKEIKAILSYNGKNNIISRKKELAE